MKHVIPGNDTTNDWETKNVVQGNETRVEEVLPGNENLWPGVTWRNDERIERQEVKTTW